MPTNRWRHLTSSSLTQVAQVNTHTITGTGGGTAVWTFTLTDDAGTTHTVSYTEDGSPTTTEVATGLYDAWEASNNPFISRITAANPSAGVVTLTADTAGIPFSVALTDNGSGTDTSSTSTSNVSYNDFQGAQNWSGNAIPDQYDDVVFEEGSANVLYNLDYSATDIGAFLVEKGCASKFGRQEFGEYYYLKVKPTSFEYRGKGQLALFDLGAENITPLIDAEGTPTTQGNPVVYLKGSNLAGLEIIKGAVGVAWLPGDTATIPTITISSESQQTGFSTGTEVYLGSGLTLTTLVQSTGRCTMECAATTATCSAAAQLITQGSGAITTLNAYGTVYPNSTGTITTLNVHGICDLTRDRTARTITNCNVYPGAQLIYPPQITFTNNIVPVTPADSDSRPILIRPVA